MVRHAVLHTLIELLFRGALDGMPLLESRNEIPLIERFQDGWSSGKKKRVADIEENGLNLGHSLHIRTELKGRAMSRILDVLFVAVLAVAVCQADAQGHKSERGDQQH